MELFYVCVWFRQVEQDAARWAEIKSRTQTELLTICTAINHLSGHTRRWTGCCQSGLIYHWIIIYESITLTLTELLNGTDAAPKHPPCRVPACLKCKCKCSTALWASALSEWMTVAALSPPSPAAVEEEEEETRFKAELIHSRSPSGGRKGKLTCQTVCSRGNLGESSLPPSSSGMQSSRGWPVTSHHTLNTFMQSSPAIRVFLLSGLIRETHSCGHQVLHKQNMSRWKQRGGSTAAVIRAH